jgi:transcriptional regulator with XRE-family HTH domain
MRTKCVTCGADYDRRWQSRHKRSLRHVNGRRLKALLEKECLTYSEIARRLRVTREWVRQIDTELNQNTGRQRHRVCNLHQRDEELKKFPFYQAAAGNGLEVRTRANSKRELLFGFKVRFLVNGWDVVTARACWHLGAISFRPTKSSADFCVWQMPDERWLIIPREEWPKKQTCFRIYKPKKKTGKRDWRAYIDRWDFLKAKKRSA